MSNDDWVTPKELYKSLDQEFNFNYDPCPLHARFNALIINWGSRNFINPPYSRKLKEAFIIKAYEQSLQGKLCVMLLPVSTSSKIFHKIILPFGEVRFLDKRVRFEGYNNDGKYFINKPARHDSMIVIFGKYK